MSIERRNIPPKISLVVKKDTLSPVRLVFSSEQSCSLVRFLLSGTDRHIVGLDRSAADHQQACFRSQIE